IPEATPRGVGGLENTPLQDVAEEALGQFLGPLLVVHLTADEAIDGRIVAPTEPLQSRPAGGVVGAGSGADDAPVRGRARGVPKKPGRHGHDPLRVRGSRVGWLLLLMKYRGGGGRLPEKCQKRAGRCICSASSPRNLPARTPAGTSPDAYGVSRMSVTGPSLTSSTCMSAPNRPAATVTP